MGCAATKASAVVRLSRVRSDLVRGQAKWVSIWVSTGCSVTMKGAVMKHCQQCNLDFPSSYHFCGSCGGALSDSTRCPGCGELAEAKWTFCTNCGGQLLSESKGDRALPSDAPPLANISADLRVRSRRQSRPRHKRRLRTPLSSNRRTARFTSGMRHPIYLKRPVKRRQRRFCGKSWCQRLGSQLHQ